MPSALSSSILDPDFARFAGFDTRNIAAWAEMGQPPDLVTVLVGRFDAGTIEKALRSSPGGDELSVQRDGDVVTFSLGAAGSNDYSVVSPIRRIGGPLVIALAADVLVWGSDASTVAACVDAHAGTTSAARLPAVADVAAALDTVAPASGGLTVPLADE